MNYLNELMINQPTNTYSYDIDTDADSEYILIGGNKSRPSGSFPPIYICEKETKYNIIDNKKKREYKSHKSSISIQQIMKERRNVKPFITLSASAINKNIE